MGCLLISSEHVGTLIDKAVEDAKNGMGNRLFDLAGVLDSIAEAQDDPILHVLPQAIGGFGTYLVTSRSLVSLPVLPETMRTRLSTMIGTAVDEAAISLETIKDQLCVKTEPDHKILMNAVGGLFRQTSILARETRALSTRRQPNPQFSVEE